MLGNYPVGLCLPFCPHIIRKMSLCSESYTNNNSNHNSHCWIWSASDFSRASHSAFSLIGPSRSMHRPDLTWLSWAHHLCFKSSSTCINVSVKGPACKGINLGMLSSHTLHSCCSVLYNSHFLTSLATQCHSWRDFPWTLPQAHCSQLGSDWVCSLRHTQSTRSSSCGQPAS